MTKPPADALTQRVRELMPQLRAEFATLIGIPSVSEWDFPEHTRTGILKACDYVAGPFRDAGVENVAALELPDTAPVITGEIPAPPGAPTVLLYSHYDVS